MRIAVLTSDVPFRAPSRRGVTAVNLQVYGVLEDLLRRGHDVRLLMIFSPLRTEPALDAAEREQLAALEQRGLTVLPPVYPVDYEPPRRSMRERLLRLLRLVTRASRLEDAYPMARARGAVARRLRAAAPDVVFLIATIAGAAATYGFRDAPKIAYSGDLDFHLKWVRCRHRALLTGAPRRSLRDLADLVMTLLILDELRRMHVKIARDLDVIGCPTVNLLDYYRRHGPPALFYCRTPMPDPGPPPAPADPSVSGRPVKIIANLGALSQTGNTFGLQLLLAKVVPALARRMAGRDYEVHLIGGGEPAPSLRPLLTQDRLVARGYVQDVDAELRSCDVFVLLNDVLPSRAFYSTCTLAWSSGQCLVLHRNITRKISEAQHGVNCLMGAEAEEIASLIAAAATDPALNRRIREGGRRTFEQHFSIATVTEEFCGRMQRLVDKRPVAPCG